MSRKQEHCKWCWFAIDDFGNCKHCDRLELEYKQAQARQEEDIIIPPRSRASRNTEMYQLLRPDWRKYKCIACFKESDTKMTPCSKCGESKCQTCHWLHYCSGSPRPNRFRCMGCKHVFYNSKEQQRQAWPLHKWVCHRFNVNNQPACPPVTLDELNRLPGDCMTWKRVHLDTMICVEESVTKSSLNDERYRLDTEPRYVTLKYHGQVVRDVMFTSLDSTRDPYGQIYFWNSHLVVRGHYIRMKLSGSWGRTLRPLATNTVIIPERLMSPRDDYVQSYHCGVDRPCSYCSTYVCCPGCSETIIQSICPHCQYIGYCSTTCRAAQWPKHEWVCEQFRTTRHGWALADLTLAAKKLPDTLLMLIKSYLAADEAPISRGGIVFKNTNGLRLVNFEKMEVECPDISKRIVDWLLDTNQSKKDVYHSICNLPFGSNVHVLDNKYCVFWYDRLVVCGWQ